MVRSVGTGAERLLDRILCVLGATIFSQLPEFMQQYLQRLEGHLDEARRELGKFTDAAAQSGMTLDQLVAGAGRNADPAMRTLGSVAKDASVRVDTLSAADLALRHATVWTRPYALFTHLDWGIARATASIYRPAVPTTLEGLVYAAVGVLAALSLYHLLIRAPIARGYRRRHPRAFAPS